GDIIEVPLVYAKRVECTILSPKIDKEKESMEALNGGNGYRTFMNLMKDVIHERKHHEDIGAQVEATKVYERDLQHSISFSDLDIEPILADQSLSNEVSDNDVEEEIISILKHETKLGNLKIKISAPNSPKNLEENSSVMCDDHFSTYDEDVCMSMEEKNYVIHEKEIYILNVSKDMMASKSEIINTQKKFGSINSIMVIVA
ncbi:hypothetical protein L7F22_038266, partial [Adiantum nelumboides]|nr:hypothetical protein [Adiantum nelumboides]